MNSRYISLLASLLLTLAGLLPGRPAAAQALTEASYNLDFVAGQYQEASGDLVLVFRYAPKPGQEYKPIFSQRFTYSLGPDGKEQQVLFGAPNRHSIVAHDAKLREADLTLYQWLRDKVDFASKEQFMLAVFYLRGLADQYYPTMTYTYGFWEPKNTKVRFERRYQLALEHK